MLNNIVDVNFLNTKKYEHIKDNLMIIYNFIDKKEVEAIYKIINLENNTWDYSYGNFSKYLAVENFEIFNSLTNKVQNILKNSNLTTSGFHTIHKFEINDMIPEHVDYGDHYDNMLYGGVIYLNDDFDGGELYYTELDVTIKPVAMAMALHPADAPHMVKPMNNGIRYSLPFFIWKDLSVVFK